MLGSTGLAHSADPTFGSTITLTSESSDPRQVMFQVGIHELNKGNYESAAKVFNALSKITPSPRVKLELARALFLAKQYEESEDTFESILKDDATPWAVRDNVRSYLDEIDLILGSLKFSVAIVSDSNPLNFTDKRQIKIAGQTLSLAAPPENKEVFGLKYGVNGAKALTDDKSLLGHINLSFSDYEGNQFDRWLLDAGLLYRVKQLPKLKVKAGIEESFYAGDHLYQFPYIGFIYTPDPLNEFQLSTEFKYGALDVIDADHLDANNFTLTTSIKRDYGNGFVLSSDIYLESSTADEDANSYKGGMLGIGVSLPVFDDWGLDLFGSIGIRQYYGPDPFFGDTRDDVKTKLGFTVSNKSFRVQGFSYKIGLSYEENQSTLDFHDYDKLSLVFKIFQ